ncbi:MAG: hypothetical protein DMG30_04855 [Acidobacteria bacterium]|nr:MAG: hypothetical protein DMG30_04855 [Acidobacteriota bacterium]
MPSASPYLFGQSAGAYSAFRPESEYPPELLARVLSFLPPERCHCAMYLGAGTGKSTILLDHFAEVIAIEADPLIVEKLRTSAPGAIIRSVSVEDCIQEPSSVDLVTVFAALDWMNIPRVMINIARWLRP